MWQSPNQKSALLSTVSKRKRERLSKQIRLTRVRAEVRLKPRVPLAIYLTSETPSGDEPIETRVMLNDISKSGICVYSNEPLPDRMRVSIKLDEPLNITIEGLVIWSQEDPAQRVISENRFSTRVGIKLIFETDDEFDSFSQYLANLHKELYPK